MSNFYGTGIEIWAGFGAILKKKIGPIISIFLGWFFHVFKVKIKFIENIVASALKSYIR